MKKLIALIALACFSCIDEHIEPIYVIINPEVPKEDTCSFDDSVRIETEVPVPVYAFTLDFTECDESLALFRENINYSGDLLVIFSGTGSETITFTNSVGESNSIDQAFSIIEEGELVGNGIVENGVAKIISYAPPGSQFYYRNFNSNGWTSPYESDQSGFCVAGDSSISNVVPSLNRTLLDNDDGWGDDVMLHYVFNPVTGQYEACISGVADYTVEWNINETIYFGDDVDLIVGKSKGIYFVSATIYHNDQRMTLSHNVVKNITSKDIIRKAIIRTSSGG